MATYNAATAVRVADQSSQFRGGRGVVKTRDGDKHYVRLEGHPNNSVQLFLGAQLKTDGRPARVDYSQAEA